MEARREEKIESKGKRFGWRIAISYSINVILWISYKIFVFRSEKKRRKEREGKRMVGRCRVFCCNGKEEKKEKIDVWKFAKCVDNINPSVLSLPGTPIPVVWRSGKHAAPLLLNITPLLWLLLKFIFMKTVLAALVRRSISALCFFQKIQI